jgi:beta-phosphoglucomutase
MVVFPGGLQADAVIFDFDGVIVDTEPIHYRAFQRVLEPLGLDFSWQEYVETYMGFDDRDAFYEAFTARGRLIDSSELHGLIDRKAGIFQEIIRDGITAYPGAVSLIRRLHNERIPLAICSGALLSDVTPILVTLGVNDCFSVIITADDVAKSKPDPESYCLAFDKLRMQPSQATISQTHTIAIEDTPAGITAAKTAGLQVVAVTNSYPLEFFSEADCIVASLEELCDFSLT